MRPLFYNRFVITPKVTIISWLLEGFYRIKTPYYIIKSVLIKIIFIKIRVYKTDRKKKFRNLRVPMQEIPPCRCKNHKYQCCAPDAAVIFRKLSGLVKTAGCRDLGQKATSEGPKTARNRDFRNWRVPMREIPPRRWKNRKYQSCAPDPAVIFWKLSGLVKTAGCWAICQKVTTENPR